MTAFYVQWHQQKYAGGILLTIFEMVIEWIGQQKKSFVHGFDYLTINFMNC